MRLPKNPIDAAELPLVGEIAAIADAQRRLDVDALSVILADLVARPALALAHPLDGTPTRARSSRRIGPRNVVFFADDAGGHRWLLVQVLNLVDGIVFDGGVGILQRRQGKAVLRAVATLAADRKFLAAAFAANAPFAGVVASYRTPFHFFYDFARNLVPVADALVAAGRGAFHVPGELYYPLEAFGAGLRSQPLPDDGAVRLYATGVQQNIVNALGVEYGTAANDWRDGTTSETAAGPAVARAMRAMEERVRAHALRTPPVLDVRCADPRGITLLLAICDDKRAWIGQVDGLAALVARFAAVFPEVSVVFDGMTAPHGERTAHPRDEETIARIRARLPPGVRTHSIVGFDYASKIAVVEHVDLFVGDAGTAAMVPLRFCRKPSVLFSNGHVLSFPDRYDASVGKVPHARVRLADHADTDRLAFVSFEMDWRDVYAQCRPVLAHAYRIDLPALAE